MPWDQPPSLIGLRQRLKEVGECGFFSGVRELPGQTPASISVAVEAGEKKAEEEYCAELFLKETQTFGVK